MIFGIGIDIIEIERIKQSYENFGEAFLNKIFTENEKAYCLSKSNIYQHLAARFAAKEAISKALSTGWSQGFRWKDIEIYNEPSGMPQAKLYGKLEAFVAGGRELKITMSHSDNYVTCFAIIYGTDS